MRLRTKGCSMSELKQTARSIFSDTLAAIDIPAIMRHKLQCSADVIHVNSSVVDLSDYDKIRVVSIGKASVAMARGLVEVLGRERAIDGLIVAPADAVSEVPGFRTLGAGHPLPTLGR